jgi:outer membrane biosynthesis protein TonB
VEQSDDPLRADDALVGAEPEDVLLGSGAADEGDPRADHADSTPGDVREEATSVVSLDDRPTTELPPVVGPALEPRGRFAGVASWAVFAAVAVVVIAATTTLGAWLQGPTAERQSFTGLIQPVPTSTASAPPAAAPAPTPSAEPAPEPAPEKQPAARPTQRPRATRAPAPAQPPPPAAAVNAPTTPEKKPEAPGAKTSAASAPAAAGADGAVQDSSARDSATDSAAKDSEKQSTDSDDDKEGAASASEDDN